MIRKALIVVLACVASAFTANAENVGDTTFRIAYGSGALLQQISRSTSGALSPGKIIREYPVGTIFEATYMGNGYYSTTPFDCDTTGILTGTWEIKPELADPRNMFRKVFGYEKYAVEYPSLGDVPEFILWMSIEPNPEPTEETGDIIVDVCKQVHPGQANEQKIYYRYYGTMLPYCISVTKEQLRDKIVPFGELRIYCSGNYGGGDVSYVTVGDVTYQFDHNY